MRAPAVFTMVRPITIAPVMAQGLGRISTVMRSVKIIVKIVFPGLQTDGAVKIIALQSAGFPIV